MTAEIIITIIAAIFAFGALVFFIFQRTPYSKKHGEIERSWKSTYKMLASPKKWSLAILQADEILDKALKSKRVKGETFGERLVSFQDMFTDNDGIWQAHKLANNIRDTEDSGEVFEATEAQTKQAMLAFGQALKDIGVI